MLTIEGDRHNIYDLFPKRIHHICTMKKTKNMCNVKGTNSKGEEFIKYPKMAELFAHVFPNELLPDNMHNSLIDSMVCLRCYIKLEKDIDIYKTNFDFKVLYDTFLYESGMIN